ncbi:hypothetical protein NliqN6_3848 [Naganishia liquefaciens]|uniref:Rhodanese domain-containing protein n=1 Tax=Naganishia liquefaciens TaxID=104408 RepID=A0A8H3YHA1_9TREE|nr:hypothetical protein NliqN6_3848 [Naganishia liquefaciens]
MSALASIASTAKRAISPARTAATVPLLINPTDLVNLPKATTKVLDVSWHMPNSARKPTPEYLAGPRIPGALRWDLDRIANPKTAEASARAEDEPEAWRVSELAENILGLGHMLPGPRRFAEACSKLGIKPTDHVVVYDSLGIFSAPRGAFTFTAMNHEKVSVLDGGLPRYRVEGFPLDEQPLASEEEGMKQAGVTQQSEYPVPSFKRSHVKTYEQVAENAKQDIEADTADLVLDARSRERWSGAAPEPRPGISSGHMPHALSLPFTALLSPTSADGTKSYTTFLPIEQLREVIVRALASPRASLDLAIADGGLTAEELAVGRQRWAEIQRGQRGVTWSCGSGMTAAVGIWAMRLVAAAEGQGLLDNLALYDESWTGYAMRESSEIVKE